VSIAYRKAYTAMAYGGLFGLNSTGELIASRPQTGGRPAEHGALGIVRRRRRGHPRRPRR